MTEMEEAEFPWGTAVARRDAEMLDSRSYKIGQFVAVECLRCNDRTGQHVQSSMAAGLVLKCGRCGNRSPRAKR